MLAHASQHLHYRLTPFPSGIVEHCPQRFHWHLLAEVSQCCRSHVSQLIPGIIERPEEGLQSRFNPPVRKRAYVLCQEKEVMQAKRASGTERVEHALCPVLGAGTR